jgi:hypothetical protein
MRAFLLPSSLILLTCTVALADGADTAAARAHLQQGYALKQKGKCDEAVPHLVESVRLDRQPKSLANLADCEEKLGRLAAAQAHWVEVRDLAKAQGVAPLVSVSTQHLTTLDRRMPKLVVKLAKDAPSETVVLRDGAQLGPVSLNTPLPIDPGKHVIVARANDKEKTYEINLSEAETKEIEVTVEGGRAIPDSQTTGAPSSTSGVPSSPSSSVSAAPSAPSSSNDASLSEVSRSHAARNAIEYALLGLGVAGVTVGVVEAIQVKSKNDQIASTCPGSSCQNYPAYNDGLTLRDDAKSARTISMIGFGVGGVALVTDAVLLFTTPRDAPRSSLGTRVSPLVGTGAAGVVVEGTWR